MIINITTLLIITPTYNTDLKVSNNESRYNVHTCNLHRRQTRWQNKSKRRVKAFTCKIHTVIMQLLYMKEFSHIYVVCCLKRMIFAAWILQDVDHYTSLNAD